MDNYKEIGYYENKTIYHKIKWKFFQKRYFKNYKFFIKNYKLYLKKIKSRKESFLFYIISQYIKEKQF